MDKTDELIAWCDRARHDAECGYHWQSQFKAIGEELTRLRSALAKAEAERDEAKACLHKATENWSEIYEKAQQRAAEAEKRAEEYLDAIFAIGDDGWLYYGEEGMSPVQERVYKIMQEHPEYKRRVAAALKENANG